jgi:hypothetical protein
MLQCACGADYMSQRWGQVPTLSLEELCVRRSVSPVYHMKSRLLMCITGAGCSVVSIVVVKLTKVSGLSERNVLCKPRPWYIQQDHAVCTSIVTMGRIFKQYLSCNKVYSCATCRTHTADYDEIVSKVECCLEVCCAAQQLLRLYTRPLAGHTRSNYVVCAA